MGKSAVDDKIVAIASEQRRLEAEYREFRGTHPEIFEKVKHFEEALDALDDRKRALKAEMTKAGDFDLHEFENGKLKVSVTNICRVEVDDPEKVPDEYKKYGVVIDEKGAKTHYILTGEVPRGFKDKSYQRLVWEDKSDGED